MKTKEPAEKRGGESVCATLAHPLRIRILEVLNEGPKSPSQFVEEGLVPKGEFKSYQQALSLVSYHFRKLEENGCLKVVKSIPRRGAIEHVYEGKARVYFTDAEFERLPLRDRRRLSRISFQGLVARAEGAMRANTFDARTDRHLTWVPMSLDEQGWDEFTDKLASCYGEIERIRHEAKDRLAGSGEEAIPATFGMVGFESPPPVPLPSD